MNKKMCIFCQASQNIPKNSSNKENITSISNLPSKVGPQSSPHIYKGDGRWAPHTTTTTGRVVLSGDSILISMQCRFMILVSQG